MPFFSFLNDNSDISDIFINDSTRFSPLSNFAKQMMRGPSDLSCSQREMIAAFVSALNECQYCFGVHQKVAENFGIVDGLVEQLIENIDTAVIDETMKPILKYVKKLTQSPSKIYEDDAQAVFDAGWSEQALQDVIFLTALFNLNNRLSDGYGIKGNDAIFNVAGRMLKEKGYGVLPWFAKFLKPWIAKKKQKSMSDYLGS